MITEYGVDDYYTIFINQIKQDINLYNGELAKINSIIDDLNNYIVDNRQNIKDIFCIDIDKYPIEIQDKNYNNNKDFDKLIRKLYINWNDTDENKKVLLNLLKYCEYLKKKNYYNKQLEIVNDRVKITRKEYKAYLKKYYYKVHEVLLKGYGYKYSAGIGIIWLKRIIHSDKYVPHTIDYVKTRDNKKKLIEMGKTPYNYKDAMAAKENNEEYDGIRYSVLLNDKTFIMMDLTNSYLLRHRETDFKHSWFIARKFRGVGFKTVADLYTRTLEDISALDVDIRYKLNIMLYKFPHLIINFITIDNNDYLKKPND